MNNSGIKDIIGHVEDPPWIDVDSCSLLREAISEAQPLDLSGALLSCILRRRTTMKNTELDLCSIVYDSSGERQGEAWATGMGCSKLI
jgi:hypothetical protein